MRGRRLIVLLFLVGLFRFIPAAGAEPPLVIAHRGGGQGTVDPESPPENTLAALRFGFDQGADGCELDCHLTRDGQVVVIHDFSTRRTAGANLTVSEVDRSQLSDLDAGSWKHPTWKAERLPDLSEALATVPEGRQVFIEIKPGPETAPAICRVVLESRLKPCQVTLISFNLDTLKALRHRLPDYRMLLLMGFGKDAEGRFRTGHLVGPGHGRQVPLELVDLPGVLSEAHLQGVAAACQGPQQELADLARSHHFLWASWTVNDPALARHLAELGAFAIITDRPAAIRQALTGQPR